MPNPVSQLERVLIIREISGDYKRICEPLHAFDKDKLGHSTESDQLCPRTITVRYFSIQSLEHYRHADWLNASKRKYRESRFWQRRFWGIKFVQYKIST